VRPSDREFAEFNGLLHSIVEEGLPLPPAIRLMSGMARSRGLREVLAGVAAALEDGTPLPEALARYPEAFSAEYVALVRAGVEGGRLPEVLRTSEIHSQYRARLRSKFARLALYLLAGALVGELALIITQLAGDHVNLIYEQLDMKGPRAEEDRNWLLLTSGWGLPILWPLSVLLTVAAVYALERWASVGWLAYLFPIWGRVQKSRDLSVFCGTLGLRLRAGSTMVEALRSARGTVGNSRFRRTVDRLVRRVEDGESLSGAIFYQTFFPKTLSWGLALAEESGELPRTLDTFAGLYTSQMERNFDLLYEFLTPLGILVVGNVTLLAATMLLMPFLRIHQALAGL
jgi:general secretion pathway protein F